MSQTPDILVRTATPDDLRFVHASWFESYRKGGRSPEVGFDVYQREQGALIARLVNSQEVIIAAARAVPDEICGWVCRDRDVAHYVYVKKAYRRLKIATQLCQFRHPLPTWHTHETRAGMRFAAHVSSRFNPYRIHT